MAEVWDPERFLSSSAERHGVLTLTRVSALEWARFRRWRCCFLERCMNVTAAVPGIVPLEAYTKCVLDDVVLSNTAVCLSKQR